MSITQRYVSKELTHFVAWNKETPQEQYAVLAQILHAGWLTTTPGAPGSPKPLAVIPGRKISKNRMYASHAICFCDIPVGDLGIHIAKYSPFGLAFSKTYLLQKGVNPVFYIANDSVVGRRRLPDGTVTSELVKREEHINWLARGIYYRFAEGTQLLQENPDLPPPVREFLRRYQDVDAHCLHHILAYLKPFDVAQEDADPDNFYMEREWRTPADVQFTLADVCRVILPKDWEDTFRRDFPGYAREVTHAPDGIVRIPRTVPPAHEPDEIGLTMTIQLARVGTGEKSSAKAWFGPMGDPESGVEVELKEPPSENADEARVEDPGPSRRA